MKVLSQDLRALSYVEPDRLQPKPESRGNRILGAAKGFPLSYKMLTGHNSGVGRLVLNMRHSTHILHHSRNGKLAASRAVRTSFSPSTPDAGNSPGAGWW